MVDTIKSFEGSADTLETFDLDSLDLNKAYMAVANYHMEEGAMLKPLKRGNEIEVSKPLEPISSGLSSADFLALVASYAQEHGARIIINDDQGVLIEGSLQACRKIKLDMGDDFQSVMGDSGAARNYITHLRTEAEKNVGLEVPSWEAPKPTHLH